MMLGRFLKCTTTSRIVKANFGSTAMDLTTVEIERKFLCNEQILKNVESFSKGNTFITMADTYLDTLNYDLTKRDMWLRLRNKHIELKWPKFERSSTGGIDYYNETIDEDLIAQIIQSQMSNINEDYKPKSKLWNWLDRVGIRPFGTIHTQRARYAAHIPLSNSKMQTSFVDIDSVVFEPAPHQIQAAYDDYGYAIGEIELCHPLGTTVDPAAQEIIMNEIFQVLGIEPGLVRGKVLEYLARFRPRHYQALEECGLISSKGI